jgi:hypothetical protein
MKEIEDRINWLRGIKAGEINNNKAEIISDSPGVRIGFGSEWP